MKNLKYNCIFGGGAVRGICYVGALKALQELNVEISSLAGSSVGAVFASLLAVGYNYKEIENLFIEFNFNTFRDINIGFSPDLAFSKGEVFLNWLRKNYSYKVYGEKSSERKVFFKDLKKDLFILTTDITKNKPFVFSKQSTPDVEVAFAVRISASMPGLMKSVNYNNSVLVDGDLSKSRALWKTDKNLVKGKERVLEFRLEGSKDENIKNPIDYFTTIYNTFSYLCTSNVIEEYGHKDKFDYVVFDTKDLLLIDFSISQQERFKLIELGYNETIKYFKNDLLLKKEKMLPLYRFLFRKISELKKCVKANNYMLSFNKVNEILSSSINIFETIDTIYNTKLIEIKQLIEENRKRGLLTSNRMSERTKILSLIDNIQDGIFDKIQEFEEYIKAQK